MINGVVKKIVFYIDVLLESPLSVSGGDEEITDHDVLRDYDGKPFIPGSSLAGAMRAYLQKAKQENCMFGFSVNDSLQETGKMSSVYVSDLIFTDTVKTTIRDSVSLSADKTAVTGNKFDMEVIDSGAKGRFILEWIVRAQDNEIEMKKQLQTVFTGWNRKEIRLGSKKTRGYGELKILSVKMKGYTKENIEEYRFAYQSETAESTFQDVTKEWLVSSRENRYILLEIPLKFKGGISIRQYASRKGEPDYVHITANGKPVIPGTSMTGAIRHRMRKFLYALSLSRQEAEQILDGIFGTVKQGKGQQPVCSSVIVNECIIEGAKALVTVRNGISRFEAGTKNGALFKELTWVDGTTVLKIMVKSNETASETIGLLLLVLKDLQNGYLAVGGQTAIGRGLFEKKGEIQMDGDVVNESYYLKKASEFLCRG